jgi:hypothetical protein
MTGVVNKFQRILGLNFQKILENFTTIPKDLKPVFYFTWNTILTKLGWRDYCRCCTIPANEDGLLH